jgi:5-methylcytosine-specific restriction endonuclease McrA
MKMDGVWIRMRGRLIRTKAGALGTNWYNDFILILNPDDREEIQGIGAPPERPVDVRFQKHGWREALEAREADAWRKSMDEWRRATIATELYRAHAEKFIAAQEKEPIWFGADRCCYQGKTYEIEGDGVPGLDFEERSILIKHYSVSRSHHFKRLSREVQAFENLERVSAREVIPQSVRLFVWQRDQGKCVECGRRDGLEFDHIIPVVEGGSSTERNVQLLCKSCNLSKGARI